MKFVGKLMKLENITLSEITQSQKDRCCMLFLFIGDFKLSVLCLLRGSLEAKEKETGLYQGGDH